MANNSPELHLKVLPQDSPYKLQSSRQLIEAKQVMDTGFFKDLVKEIQKMLDRRSTDCGNMQDVPLYRAQGARTALHDVLKAPQKIIDQYVGKRK